MRFWEEIQQDICTQAEQQRERRARKIAHAFLLSAWTTPPAPEGARETAVEWAAQAMLSIQKGTEK